MSENRDIKVIKPFLGLYKGQVFEFDSESNYYIQKYSGAMDAERTIELVDITFGLSVGLFEVIEEERECPTCKGTGKVTT